jgi:hypothetical protein
VHFKEADADTSFANMESPMMNRTASRALLVVSALSALGVAACATATPQTVAADQRVESAEFREDQREDGAAFDRKQEDQRSALVADQAKERVDVSASNVDDRRTFVIESRERVARLDARIVELKALGKSVSPAVTEARDAVLAHINTNETSTVTHALWMKDRDMVKAELTALTNQVERASK